MIYFVLAASVCAIVFAALALFAARRAGAPSTELLLRLGSLEHSLERLAPLLRDEVRAGREELRGALADHRHAHETRFSSFHQDVAHGHTRLGDTLKASTESFAHTQTTRLGETNLAMRDLSDRLEKQQEGQRAQQKEGLDQVAARVQALMESNDKRQDALRESLNLALTELRKDNEVKLEQMRQTVDEKLQGTLEKRLGESFQLVSTQLEQVHKGLGEMQSLATGVGDLKRVLTNVKSRGGWGEVQLGMLLEDMLTADQYATNVVIQPGSSERVEYAVRLPGRDTGASVHLPIDAKFPHEDYERLLAAQEIGGLDEIERCGKELEKAVRLQAKTICGKYVHPPHSTDFAIMYLPTEGLFAEVIRRPGLMMELQQQHRVMLTGPTTLAAILNSLQMGFRSVAVEKRSSEVWQVLGAAKAEFQKYGDVWDKLSKQLATAQNTVTEAGKKTRAVERKLREVGTLEGPAEPASILALAAPDEDAEDAEAA